MPRTWESDRLLLSQLGPDSAAAVREYGRRSREFHAPWDPIRPSGFWDLPVVADRLSAQLIESDEGSSVCTYLSAKNDAERIIGVVNLRNITRGALMGAVIGYGLAPEVVGRGYMSEAVNRIVRVAFDDLGLHRLEINVIPRNTRSIAVATRCGFEREGFSPRYLKIAGRWEDHLRFARLSEVPR